MKKAVKLFVFTFIFFGLVLGLSACGGSAKLPTNTHEKVSFAFNGVEKSMKSASNLKSLDIDEAGTKLLTENISDSVISTIYSVLEVEKENTNPDFEYSEPPMIQFQCLKAVYEEIGDDFTFGTKYTYNLKGEIYYDFKTRTAPKKDEFLNQYSFDFSIKIDINSSDVIIAQVGFDITYTNKGVSHHQKTYSDFNLIYDMNDANPTYKLTMYHIDNLLDYTEADERYISAEFDYVDVDDNVIEEWNKFGVCSQEDLKNYKNEDFSFKYSVLRAYKDHKKYKNTNAFRKEANLKTAVFEGLKFNEILTKGDNYAKESGTENEKLKTVVEKFNKIFGSDVVNNFVYTGASEKWVDDRPEEPKNLFLRILPAKETSMTTTADCTLADLFDKNKNVNIGGEADNYFSVYLKNGEDTTEAIYNDLDAFNVKVRSTSYEDAKWVDINDETKNDTLSALVKKSGFKGNYNGDDNRIGLEMDMTLKSDPNVKLQDTFYFELHNEGVYNSLLTNWNLAINFIDTYAKYKNQIPEFGAGENTYFSPEIYEEGKEGVIAINSVYTLAQRKLDYIEKLKGLEFVENNNLYYDTTYTKRLDDQYILVIKLLENNKEGKYELNLRFEFKYSEKQKETVDDAIRKLLGLGEDDFAIPVFGGDYEYKVLEFNEGIRIEVNDTSLITNYVKSYANYTFLVYTDVNEQTFAYLYFRGVLYQVSCTAGYKVIYIRKAVTSFSLVGDFNGWLQTDGTYDFSELSLDQNTGRIYLTRQIRLEKGQAFKIVKNHSWNENYGYNLWMDDVDPELREELQYGENENIVSTKGGKFTVTLEIIMDLATENSQANVVMIGIKKNGGLKE